MEAQGAGNGIAADAVEAVAAGYVVARQLVLAALVAIAHQRALRIDAHVLDLEVQRQPGAEPRGDEVLDDLLLAVDRDALPAGQVREVDPVRAAGEPQLDALVHHPLAVQPLGHSHLAQQVDGALLQHPRAHPRLDVVAVPGLDDHGVHAQAVEQVSQHETRRAGAHDRDLRAD